MKLCTGSLLLSILLSSSCLLASSIGGIHRSSNGIPSTSRTMNIARRSAEAAGCTASNGVHIPSSSSQYPHLSLSPAPVSPPIDSMDICFIISNSRTMPQRWIQILAEKIDNHLKAEGIGSNSTNQNRFSIVEFGGRGTDIEPRLLWNSSFSISNIAKARREVKKNGFVGDGFEAFKFALDRAPFRKSPLVKKAFIFGADTGRTILAHTHDLTLPLLSDLIGRSGASLDVVTNFTLYPSNQGVVPLGFYNYSSTVFNASGRGHETLKVPVKITSSHGNTLSSYVNLSLSVGGGVWSLGVTKDANVNLVSSLASAVVSGWSLKDRRACLECRCVDGVGECKSPLNQRKCRNCINNNDKECFSNDKSLAVMSATASVVYPDKHHNYVNITLSSNTDMSYKYLHFNSSNHILQYTLSPLLLHNLSLGIHTVLIIGRTSSGVETAKLVQFEIKEVPFMIQFLPSSVNPNGTLIIPFRSSWVNGVRCICEVTGIKIRGIECFNEYRANSSIIGDGNHTLTVRCYYYPDSLSVSGRYDFKLDPAPEILDRICCPLILRNSARLLVSNSTSTSSTSTHSSSNAVRTVTFSTDISTGNCSLTEGFSYKMSWSPQRIQSGSVPRHHTPMTFSMTFTDRGTHTISFSYCNNPTTRSNVCCDQLSLPLSLS